jgi:pimeloyl-ACP methyl ester carboxylesterase
MDKFIDNNGIKIHFQEFSGDGPVLILLPGLTANCRVFEGLLAAGLGQACHVVSMDLRGRGISDKPASGYSLAEHAEDVRHLIDRFRGREIIPVGHSFGGLVAVWLCAHYPELCERLILLDLAIETTDPKVVELLKPSLGRLDKTFASEKVYLDAMQLAPYLFGCWDEHLEAYFRADVRQISGGGVKPRSSRENIGACIEAVLDEDWPELFRSLKTSTLLVNAVSDYSAAGPLVPADQAQRTVRAILDCSYKAVHGNHITMLFGNDAFHTAQAITTWL